MPAVPTASGISEPGGQRIMSRTRVQMDFSEEALEHLTALQAKVDASSRAEVIKNALWLYEWLVERAEQGQGLDLSAMDLQKLTRVWRMQRGADELSRA